jgi:hypothetical protein
MRTLVFFTILAAGALTSPAAAQSKQPHGILLPTIPTLRVEGDRLMLEPGTPFDTWTHRAGTLLRARPLDAAAVRADSLARRACPHMPNAATGVTTRMPSITGDTAHMAPMPRAILRCIAA